MNSNIIMPEFSIPFYSIVLLQLQRYAKFSDWPIFKHKKLCVVILFNNFAFNIIWPLI